MEFDWDEGNGDKSFFRHGVHDNEIEGALQDPDGISAVLGTFRGEERREFLGRSRTSGKYLKIIYTIRVRDGRKFYRPISAREMSRAERSRYSR